MPSLKDFNTGIAAPAEPVDKPQHSPAVLAAIATARGKVGAIAQRHRSSPFTSWADVQSAVGFEIPAMFLAGPVTYLTLCNLRDWYANDTPARIARALAEQAKANAASTTPAWKDDALGGGLLPFNLPEDGAQPIRRVPRQRKAYTQIVRELGLQDVQHYRNPSSHAALLPLEAGAGKTAVAAMVIRHFQQQNYFNAAALPFQNVIYITPKRVKVKTARFFARAGIADLGVRVLVKSYHDLRSSDCRHWYRPTSVINPNTGEAMPGWAYAFPIHPELLIIDESHTIKKPDTATTRRVTALIGPHTRVLFMSATAAVTVMDLATFAIASRKNYDGRPINISNWREVALAIANADPRKPNARAMKSAQQFFGDAIVQPPADPRKVKCFNRVTVIPFENESQRANYMAAQERWLEKCERLGKIPSERGSVMAETTVFTAAEELIKAPTYARRAIEELAKGRAPVIGVRFINTVKEIYGHLMRYKHPITGEQLTRENISIIWGGQKIIQPHEVMGMEEWTRTLDRVRGLENGEKDLDPKVRAKFRKSTKYFQDRWSRVGADGKPETAAQQAERVRWLKETRLDQQGEAEQQEEMDRFQAGTTEICIFTLSAGGTGVDLDQQHEKTKPRTMLSTITYWVEQFVQAFGRCYRISTISDVYQEVIFFAGTIVADHVAPKLAKKMSSVNAFSASGVNLEEDLVGAVLSGKTKVHTDAPVLLDDTPIEQDDALELDDDSADDDDDSNE